MICGTASGTIGSIQEKKMRKEIIKMTSKIVCGNIGIEMNILGKKVFIRTERKMAGGKFTMKVEKRLMPENILMTDRTAYGSHGMRTDRKRTKVLSGMES